ncbi:MAG: hypothetical protein IPK85_24095 [Gemmatimonadetes bacterium]|nr:hypothetical protein [Gemmatimonadota bacterium]
MAPRSWLCTWCGSETNLPERPGSSWIAAALLVPFVIPGVVYQAWRLTSKRMLCPICGQAQLIPGDSPLARTWRHAGWIPGQSLPTGQTDPRIERIEHAIDAIAAEVERVGRARDGGQRLPPG